MNSELPVVLWGGGGFWGKRPKNGPSYLNGKNTCTYNNQHNIAYLMNSELPVVS